MTKEIVLSLYKGGFTVTFQDKKEKCYYSIQAISGQKRSQELLKVDFQKLWDVIQQLDIVEQDMTLASLDYLMATKDDNVIFRLHNISTRNDVPPRLGAILAEIIEKYLPDQQRLAEKLRGS
jgi:hypothetical protein